MQLLTLLQLELFQTSMIGLGLLCLGPLLVVLGVRYLPRRNSVVNRINEYVVEPSARRRPGTNLAVPFRELSGSFMVRVFQPLFRRVGRFFQRLTPAGYIDNLQHRLGTAGNPNGIQAGEFIGIRLALIVLGVWLAFMSYTYTTGSLRPFLPIVVLVIFYILPLSWLSRKIRERQDRIRKGMSDALDMVSVCMAAGLGFEQALQRVSEYWRTPVGIEFGRVISEIEMGLSRSDALQNMAYRLDIPELSSFVSFITQSEKMGLSVADTLHGQADQMRLERRMRAQEQAQKIPVKMLLPMVLLIFPAIMAVLLGPVVPTLMAFLTNMGGG